MDVIIVPCITSLVYFLMTLYKQVIPPNCERCFRVIPLLAGLLGIILGIVAYYLENELMPATNLFTAMLIGGASGFAATGANQVYKQFSKDKEKKE